MAKEKKRYKQLTLSPQQVHDLECEAFELAQPLLANQYSLIDTVFEQEGGQWYLRYFIEHHPGAAEAGQAIGLEDCKRYSQAVGVVLDEHEAMFPPKLSYNLEVSSPGLFRTMRSGRELDFYRNRRISVAVKGQEPLYGVLIGFDSVENRLEIKPETDQAKPIHMEWHPKTVVVSLAPENIFSVLACESNEAHVCAGPADLSATTIP